MAGSEQTFYNRYWGHGVRRSGDAPVHKASDGEAFLEKFAAYYGAGGADRTLLDFGCGEGDFLAQARARFGFGRGVGVDVSDHVIGIARARHPGLELHVLGEGKLPLPDASVDAVQSVSVLEHVLDLETALAEISRVLKPGGHFICYTTDFNWLKQVLIAAFCWDHYFDPRSPHVRYLKRKSLNRLLEPVGLAEVHYSWNGSHFGVMPQGMYHVSRKGGGSVCLLT